MYNNSQTFCATWANSILSSYPVYWFFNKLLLPSQWIQGNEKIRHICISCRLNILSTLISWSCAPWELSAANWFFSVYQKRRCCMCALITASLYTGSLQCTLDGLQSTVCQQGWPWGSRNAMNNWLKGYVYTWVVQLPVHSQYRAAFEWNKSTQITILLSEIQLFYLPVLLIKINLI